MPPVAVAVPRHLVAHHLRRAACRPAAPCRRFSDRRRQRSTPVANLVPPVANVVPPLANVVPTAAVIVPLPLSCRPSSCRPSPSSCRPSPSSQQRAPSPKASVAPLLVRRRRGAMVCVHLFAIGGDWWDAVLILHIPMLDIWRGEFLFQDIEFS